MSLIPGATGSTAKAVDGIEGASSGAPVVLPSGFQGSSRPSTLADADITLTSASNPEMVMTPTATRTITLASTGVPANYVVRVINKATSFNILINSSAGNLVATVPGGSQATVMSNIASPTTAGNWNTNSYGDVFGPGIATDNAIARFDSTTGKLVQNSGVFVDDSNNIRFSASPGTVYGKVVLESAAATDKAFLHHLVTGLVNYSVGVDSSNLYTLGTLSALDTWSTKAVQFSSLGAVTFGPPSGTTEMGHTMQGYRTSAITSILYIRNREATTASDDTYDIICNKGSTTNTTSQGFIAFYVNDGGTGSGQITANGAGAATFTALSDRRLKENITPLNGELTKILSLNPVEFDYKDGSGHQIGFIAQEVEEIYPDCVSNPGDTEKMKSLAGWDKTSARLVQAIKEQNAVIVALQARITALEAQ